LVVVPELGGGEELRIVDRRGDQPVLASRRRHGFVGGGMEDVRGVEIGHHGNRVEKDYGRSSRSRPMASLVIRPGVSAPRYLPSSSPSRVRVTRPGPFASTFTVSPGLSPAVSKAWRGIVGCLTPPGLPVV